MDFLKWGRKERSHFDISVPTIEYKTGTEGQLQQLDRAEVRKKVLSVVMDWKKLRPDKHKDAVFGLALMFEPVSKRVQAYVWPSSFSLHRDWESDKIFAYRKRLALVDASALSADIGSGNHDPSDAYKRHPLISYRFRVTDMYARQPYIEKEIDSQLDKIVDILDPKYARLVNGEILPAEGYEIVPGGFHERDMILFKEVEKKSDLA